MNGQYTNLMIYYNGIHQTPALTILINIQVSPNIEGNVIIATDATEALNVEHALDIMHAV